MRTPTFTGPIEVTGSEPFLGLQDGAFLADVGYEQREYLVSGTGAIYGPGRPDATERPSLSRGEIVPMGAVARNGVAYTTRLLVRAPRAGAPFSGTVHIEAFHNAGEIAPSWALSHGHIVASGDAWVGITVSTGSHVGDGGAASGGVEL